MNKSDLAAAVAEKTGMTKKNSELAINAIINIITESLAEGTKVRLRDFGTFEVKKRAARVGRNPRTREQISIPPTNALIFKAGGLLKESIL